MTDYTKLAKALREQSGPKCTDPICSKERDQYKECGTRIIQDAADAIEALRAAWIKSETDATNLTGKLAQAEADIDRLNLEIDKRIATEIELSNQVDALQAETERLTKENRELYLDRPELEEVGGKWVWRGPKRGEIVRCKECIHFTQGGWCDREFDWFPVDENDFCSMAEKM